MIVSSTQWYMGVPGSGAPEHIHTDAVNALVYGRKRWFLKPPEHASYSKLPPLAWFRSKEPHGYVNQKGRLPLYECVQQPGDVIFVPNGWGHQTLNIQTSIGSAFELFWRDGVTW